MTFDLRSCALKGGRSPTRPTETKYKRETPQRPAEQQHAVYSELLKVALGKSWAF